MAVSKKSREEHEQLLQTVQMFEVIVENQPNDIQSLEILKEAYLNLARDSDAVAISKKIAQVYVNTGQLSSAILEYEGILQRLPDDAECLAALGELESKMAGVTGQKTPEQEAQAVEAEEALKTAENFEDGNEALLKFFQEHDFIKEKEIGNLLAAIHGAIAETPSGRASPSLLSLISERGLASIEKSIALLAEKTRLPYLPVACYDIEPGKAMLIDRDFELKYLVLPFDQISRTYLVATANPFDARAKHGVESKIEGRVQWFLAQPLDIVKQLKDIYHLQ